MGMEHAYTYAAAALIDQVDRALSAVEGEPARVAVESSLAHTLRRLGCEVITRPLDGVEAELGLGKGALGRTNDRSIPKGKMEVWGGDGHDSGVGREQEGAA